MKKYQEDLNHAERERLGKVDRSNQGRIDRIESYMTEMRKIIDEFDMRLAALEQSMPSAARKSLKQKMQEAEADHLD